MYSYCDKNFAIFYNSDNYFYGDLNSIFERFNIDKNILKICHLWMTSSYIEYIIEKFQNKDIKELVNKNYTVYKNTDMEFNGNLREICMHFNLFRYIYPFRILNDLYNNIDINKIPDLDDFYICFKNTNLYHLNNKKEICNIFDINYSKFLKYLHKYNMWDSKNDIGEIIEKMISEKIKYNNRQKELYNIDLSVVMNNFQKAEIINYKNIFDIDVKFEDGTIVENKNYCNFIHGNIKNPNFKKIGISHNEIVCQYYLKQIGFKKLNKGSLKEIDQEFGRMEFDLYGEINGNKIAIEYDGYIHHTYLNDLKKNQLCIKNNIYLIRIREPQLEKYKFKGIKQFNLKTNKQNSKNLQNILYKIIDNINKKI